MALFGTTSQKSTASKKPNKSTVSRSNAGKGFASRTTQLIPSCEGSSFISDWANKMEHQTFVM